jgi:sigma-B regulation protein RsbU (phosphoserine phosphatase)
VNGDAQLAAGLRGDLLQIGINTTFLILGLTSCAIAALRRRGGVRVFLWIGIWSASYGLMHLLEVGAVQLVLPVWARTATPYITTFVLYASLVVAAAAWLELTVGIMRRIVIFLFFASAITAILGIVWFVFTGDVNRFLVLNNVLAVAFLLLLLVTVTSRRLFERYLLLPGRGFLVFGTVVFTVEALSVTAMRLVFGIRTPVFLLIDHFGFLVLLVAFGYSGLKMVLTNEHRLLEMQAELDVARQIQLSILPTEVPQVDGLRISATYRPMTSVAGDFYEFVPVDHQHIGILIADVCGHGVPAALIASMLKGAVRYVSSHADDPGKFLRALNGVLSGALRGQLVSAAYLWVDMETRVGRYSAAGHPPLLRWNGGLERVESNGLLFGICAETLYPVHEIVFHAGDRLLLYTDGITEPENKSGEPFDEGQLERVLSRGSRDDCDALSQRILSEIRNWRATPEQQDDMTLIVIDVG